MSCRGFLKQREEFECPSTPSSAAASVADSSFAPMLKTSASSPDLSIRDGPPAAEDTIADTSTFLPSLPLLPSLSMPITSSLPLPPLTTSSTKTMAMISPSGGDVFRKRRREEVAFFASSAEQQQQQQRRLLRPPSPPASDDAADDGYESSSSDNDNGRSLFTLKRANPVYDSDENDGGDNDEEEEFCCPTKRLRRSESNDDVDEDGNLATHGPQPFLCYRPRQTFYLPQSKWGAHSSSVLTSLSDTDVEDRQGGYSSESGDEEEEGVGG